MPSEIHEKHNTEAFHFEKVYVQSLFPRWVIARHAPVRVRENELTAQRNRAFFILISFFHIFVTFTRFSSLFFLSQSSFLDVFRVASDWGLVFELDSLVEISSLCTHFTNRNKMPNINIMHPTNGSKLDIDEAESITEFMTFIFLSSLLKFSVLSRNFNFSSFFSLFLFFLLFFHLFKLSWYSFHWRRDRKSQNDLERASFARRQLNLKWANRKKQQLNNQRKWEKKRKQNKRERVVFSSTKVHAIFFRVFVGLELIRKFKY